MSDIKLRVLYTAHCGTDKSTEVEIRDTTDYNGNPAFYAWGSLGCGKTTNDPIAAAHVLVGDYGYVQAIQTIRWVD